MTDSSDLQRLLRRKTLQLTTVGRRSGEPRTVTIWFVADGPRTILVQHVAAKPAQWYRNLCAEPAVQVDLGEGKLEATAQPIEDRGRISEVMARVGKKYWTYRLIRLFGGSSGEAVAAEITIS